MTSQILEIDIAGICSIDHKCNGCRESSKKCCSIYDVTINRQEMENIIDYLPFAAHFCINLKKDGHYLNVFDEISDNLYSIDTNEDGTCSFAYFESGKIVCALHTAADELGIAVQKVKPKSCLLWPLAVFEGEPEILSIQDDIFEFSCITKKKTETLCLSPSIADSIEKVYGRNLRISLQEAAGKGRRWMKIAS